MSVYDATSRQSGFSVPELVPLAGDEVRVTSVSVIFRPLSGLGL
jgi:hypothetical protein